MQCPKCQYEPTMAEMQQSPDCCPSCGVYYSKVAALSAASAMAAPTAKVTFAQWADSNPAIKWIAALVVGLIVGYFAGREHVKYEIRSVMAESLSGLGSLFGGETKQVATQNQPRTDVPGQRKLAQASPMMVLLSHKGFSPDPSTKREQITIRLTLSNRGPGDIRAFDGVLRITDLLDNEILSTKISVNELIKQGQIVPWDGAIDFNRFIDRHRRLRDEPTENLKLQFEMKKVLYSDGRLEEF